MKYRAVRTRAGFDWITLWIFISLLTIGWLMIYAVEYNPETNHAIISMSTSYGKQLIWIGVSFVFIAACLIIHPTFWRTFAYPMLFLALILLILVLFFGQEIKGSLSWFTFGPISLQPGEVAKFPALLAISSYLAYYRTDLRKNKHFFTALAILGIPVGAIMLQPDAGMAITYSALLIVLYRAGANPIWYWMALSLIMLFVTSVIYDDYYVIITLVLGASAFVIYHFREKVYWFSGFAFVLTLAVLSMIMEWWIPAMVLSIIYFLVSLIKLLTTREQRLVFLISPIVLLASIFSFSSTYVFDNVLKPHQQDRINVWLQPELCDPRGSLYNVLQSKLALGSGGLSGKGFLNGTLTKLNYVPEQNTDFIFVTVGEEQGFIGGVAVILLYTILIIRIFYIAERMKNDFDRSFAYGLGAFLFVHFLINIGMTMGLVPVIGIPLPFLSYGGSSLLVFSIMMGVLFRLDMDRRRA
ncbi:MAG: rod shape-determining protein RodA [Saprospirales bacterium]|nr:MAG: rod shape-determining protein RodA [Saprospirales bacterium]